MCKQIDPALVGRAIKALRVNNHMTQDYLSDVLGYSVRNIRRIENYGTSSIDVVNVFAEIFNVSALDILNGCFLFLIIKLPRNRHWQPSPYNTYF